MYNFLLLSAVRLRTVGVSLEQAFSQTKNNAILKTRRRITRLFEEVFSFTSYTNLHSDASTTINHLNTPSPSFVHSANPSTSLTHTLSTDQPLTCTFHRTNST